MSETIESCAGCYYWRPLQERAKADIGRCHRMPPSIDIGILPREGIVFPSDYVVATQHAYTVSGDWCGEFIPKEKP